MAMESNSNENNETKKKEPTIELHRPALETLRTLIRTSTSSMTSVPKPLKFLRPHYPALQSIHSAMNEADNKVWEKNSIYNENIFFSISSITLGKCN